MDNKPFPPTSGQSSADASGQSTEAIAPSSPPPRVIRESPLRDVFLGPSGVYAGTRWLIYLALAWTVYQVEGWLVISLRSSLGLLWWRMIVEGSMMLAVLLPGVLMARIENRPFADFGLPARRAFGRNFWVGTLWGIASLSVLMLALRVTGAFEFGSLAVHGPRIWKFAAYYAALFLVTGVFEEFLARGYSQWVLGQAMNFWPAAAFL